MGVDSKTTSNISNVALLDEDDFASDSNTQAPTQQSAKAYVNTVVSDWVSDGAITLTASTSNPTKGTTTVDDISYKRLGDTMKGRVSYKQTTGAAASGTGTYLITIPNSKVIDTAKFKGVLGGTTGNTRSAMVGVGHALLGTVRHDLVITAYSTTKLGLSFSRSTVDGTEWASTSQTWAADLEFSFTFEVPITGWDN